MSDVVLDYSGQELNEALAQFRANYKDTSDGNITKDTVLEGQVGYNAEGKVVGEMPDNGAINLYIDGITETSSTIPQGYHNGEGSVSLTDDIANEVDSQTDIISQIKSVLQGKAAGGKQEQSKELNVTENGSYVVKPDDGFTLSGVDVNVEVSGEPNSKELFYYEDFDEEGYPHTIVITKSISSNTIENGRTIPKLFATHYYGQLEINSRITKVVLPEDINVLDNTLMISKKMDEIQGWDNLIYIGNSCFYSCDILLKIKSFPPNLIWLGNQALDRCGVQENLPDLPDGLINIGKGCFNYCWSGKNIEAFRKLPSNLTTIGDNAFYNNGFGLFPKTVYIPTSVKTIGGAAFQGAICNTERIIFYGTPESIGTNAFNDLNKTTGIRDVYVPWSDGEIANQPWGATNATFHFNTQYDADGNPITT